MTGQQADKLEITSAGIMFKYWHVCDPCVLGSLEPAGIGEVALFKTLACAVGHLIPIPLLLWGAYFASWSDSTDSAAIWNKLGVRFYLLARRAYTHVWKREFQQVPLQPRLPLCIAGVFHHSRAFLASW